MKVLTVLGSPRKTGNTAKVLENVEGLLRNTHKVERIDIASHDVRGCLGCNKCQENLNEPACVQKDDGPILLEKVLNADVIIYGTPLYGHSYSAQMKAFLDRHVAFFKLISGAEKALPEMESLIEGKRIALLVTCQGPVENNADLIGKLFARHSLAAKTELVGSYVVPFCTTPDNAAVVSMEISQRIASDINSIEETSVRA
jgi:putative NADPH-quinone reductase